MVSVSNIFAWILVFCLTICLVKVIYYSIILLIELYKIHKEFK